MFRRAQRAVVVAVLTLIPGTAMAQTVWQPAPPPTVTAETTSWYLANEPITINGEPYYPSGAIQFFNGFQMVRSGSFNGIPLYIDMMSYQYLDGTEIDYVEGLHGAGFKFLNPQAKSTCGCGSSFSA